ncbi:MAG: GntR family transcriptional regulator [Thermoleophilaceae bacterium]|jgi:DNA-binding transcriptional regulator YhcF (GntR family)
MSPPLPSDIDFSVARDGELPIGTQLVWKLRSLIESGALEPGDRLPSVRTMAEAAGVNVNTARSVYGRLEHAGLIRSEHGRGTFVTPQAPIAEPGNRSELLRQIADLERQLLRRPAAASEPAAPPRRAGGRLTTTEELRDIRDGLSARLRTLDAERAEVLRQLAEIDQPAPDSEARRSTASLRGAKVRWVGA